MGRPTRHQKRCLCQARFQHPHLDQLTRRWYQHRAQQSCPHHVQRWYQHHVQRWYQHLCQPVRQGRPAPLVCRTQRCRSRPTRQGRQACQTRRCLHRRRIFRPMIRSCQPASPIQPLLRQQRRPPTSPVSLRRRSAQVSPVSLRRRSAQVSPVSLRQPPLTHKRQLLQPAQQRRQQQQILLGLLFARSVACALKNRATGVAALQANRWSTRLR